MPPRAFAEYRDTPLWHVLASAVAELEATREIAVATAPEYVIGYLCQRLVSSHAVRPETLRDEP
ncbi:MAG TPA: hypothetical protein VFX39_09365 [Gemmatimonadaceae bacterium]|nr:hypothetical protein [Gemmatimonadaceae bacterium]